MGDVVQIKKKLSDYINKNTLSNNKNINKDTLIFRDGIFDSMGFVLLIDFLEEYFNVFTNDEDMIEENFESVNAIAQYILRKQA